MATFTAVAAGGDWRSAATWDLGSSYPQAGDTVVINATLTGTVTIAQANACTTLNMTANGGTLAFGAQTLTVSGVATLQGAMTATPATAILSVAGGVTLAGTPTGSFPKLTIAGASTLTSGGFTWGGTMNLSVAGNVTLSGNWINTGLLTFTAATNLLKTAAETYTTNGGLTMTSASGATGTLATIVIGGTGGIWSGNNELYNSLTFNCTTATVSGTVRFLTGVLTYTAGTITTTSSTLFIKGSCTLDTDRGATKISWSTIQLNFASATYTLASALTCVTLTTSLSAFTVTFAGAFNITCDNLFLSTQGAIIYKFVSGTTLTVNTSMVLCIQFLLVAQTLTIQATTGSSSFALNYLGTAANCKVFGVIFTDVNAGGSSIPIDNWYGGTLTRCNNVINRTSADLKQTGVWNEGSSAGTVTSDATSGVGGTACALINPSSVTYKLYWAFLLPCTAATSFQVAFSHKITTGFNGSLKCTIYDSDNATIKLNAETVTLTNDGAYHTYTSTAITPTSTGFVKVLLTTLDGAVSGDIYVDDIIGS